MKTEQNQNTGANPIHPESGSEGPESDVSATDHGPFTPDSSAIENQKSKIKNFCDSSVLEQIGPARLAKFFSAFDDRFQVGLGLPAQPTLSDYSELAAILADTENRTEQFRCAMLTLESAASPENCARMDAAIARRIPNVATNPYCPLDRALELFFQAPDELAEFNCRRRGHESLISPPPAAPESFPPPSPEPPHPESSIQNPESAASASLSTLTPPPSTPPNPSLLPHHSTTPLRQSSGDRNSRDNEALRPLSTLNSQPLTSSASPPIENQKSKIKNAHDQDQVALQALAHLSLVEYDRTRKQSARQLGIRVETLDAEVTRVRNQIREDEAFDSALRTLHSPLPWPEPVDAAELLRQIVERFRHYLILPPGAAEAFTLWSAHAHCFSAFIQSPRLNISSPEPGCGKTTALDVLATLTPRALRTENLTAPVLFRLVHQYQPTLLLDEVDSWLPQAEELRGLLNAGHKRGACAYRCEGEGNAVRPFRAFAPAVLAGIGQLTGTLHDRSIVVSLSKAQQGETPHRFDDHRIEIETELCRKLARWTADNFAALKSCEPPLPPTAFNRLADNWRPLFAIAQLAGGPWPELALNSFNHLANPALPPALEAEIKNQKSKIKNGHSPSSEVLLTKEDQLLCALRHIFAQSGATRLSAKQLIEALSALPDPSIQQSAAKGQLTPARLSRQLACLGIHPRNLRIAGRVVRGFESTDFIPREDMRDL